MNLACSGCRRMKPTFKEVMYKILMILLALSIPLLLILNGIQAERYKKLMESVKELESKQVELVEENKKLITDIGLLSSTERIEEIAEEKLGMRKAESEEIIRVEMKDTKK